MPRAQLTKEKVIDAALNLANTQGLEQLSLKDLAKELNIKPPSLYNHVKNIAELRLEIHRRGLEELSDVLPKAIMGLSGEAALVALSSSYRQFAKEQPALFFASLETIEDKPELHDIGGELLEVFSAVFHGFELKGEDVIHAIRTYRAALTGFIYLELQGAFGMDLSIDTSFSKLVEGQIVVFKKSNSDSAV